MKIRFSSLAACSELKVLENQLVLPSGRLLSHSMTVTGSILRAHQMGLSVLAQDLQYHRVCK